MADSFQDFSVQNRKLVLLHNATAVVAVVAAE